MHKFEDIIGRLTHDQADAIEGRFDTMADSDGDKEWVIPGCEEGIKQLARSAHLVLEFDKGPVGFWRIDDRHDSWIYIDLSSEEPFLGFEFGAEEFAKHMAMAAEELV